jgi:hypothetical protein
MRKLMGKLKLTVNAEKTRICKVPGGEFDFLGFTFGRMYSARTGQARLALRPSKNREVPPIPIIGANKTATACAPAGPSVRPTDQSSFNRNVLASVFGHESCRRQT